MQSLQIKHKLFKMNKCISLEKMTQKLRRHHKSMTFTMNTMKTCGMVLLAAWIAKFNTLIIWPSTLKFIGVLLILKFLIKLRPHSIDGTQMDISTCATMLQISMQIGVMEIMLPLSLKVLTKTSVRSSLTLRSNQE